MIVPMSKVHVVSAAADRDRLLGALGRLGVLHIRPVDPAGARAEEKTLTAIDHIGRALQVLADIAPAAGRPPKLGPEQAAEEVLATQRQSAELHSRLANLHLQHEHLAVWGDLTVEQLNQLKEAGLTVRFLVISARDVDAVKAECVHLISRLPGREVLVGTVDREGPSPELPTGAREVPPPATDRPAIRREAARIDKELKDLSGRLTELATIRAALVARRRQLQGQADYMVACRSGLADADLFALQGWVPSERADRLPARLAEMGVRTAVQVLEPGQEDSPPTLLRAPRWARPAEALLRALGTVPGYREQDVSPAFMIALPIFAAMLISDAGYGLLFLLVPALFYRRLSAKLGKGLTHLLMVFGIMALAWGIAIGSYFGFAVGDMIRAGGAWAAAGGVLSHLKLLSVEMTDESQETLKRISFLLAAMHLSGAHLWRAVLKFPNIRFLSSVGWAATLWGVYGLVKMLVLKDAFLGTAYPYLLFGGLALAIGFASPRKHVIDGIVLGALNSIFPAIATFGDTISYVRLMAIGLAGSVLAASFNKMTLGIGFLPVSVPLFLITHLLNIGLVLIALLAHGVRLNILEFSTNFGMEWSGYPYEPFVQRSEEN